NSDLVWRVLTRPTSCCSGMVVSSGGFCADSRTSLRHLIIQEGIRLKPPALSKTSNSGWLGSRSETPATQNPTETPFRQGRRPHRLHRARGLARLIIRALRSFSALRPGDPSGRTHQRYVKLRASPITALPRRESWRGPGPRNLAAVPPR